MKKINLSALMTAAWRFVREYGFTMSEALKQAWMQFKLRSQMTKGVVRFFYKKVDGTLREAYGTLDTSLFDYVSKNSEGFTRRGDCFLYWDIEKNAFRRFKIYNLISVA